MSEENEFTSRPDYEESELFPSENAPKPLFPQTEAPTVRPLFDSPAEPEAVVNAPFTPEKIESVVSPTPRDASSEEMRATPPDEPLYKPNPDPPAIAEPVIVDHSEPKEAPQTIHPVSSAPLSSPAMTEKAPEKSLYEESKKTPVRRVSSSRHSGGEVRERFPIMPNGKKEEKKLALAIDLDAASLGTIMKEARVQAGFTVQKAAGSSRIKEIYINALESDDFHSLPKGIFPNAYVRTLCDLYRLNDDAREASLRKVAENLEKLDVVPTELLQQIDQNVQRNEQEELRITKIFYAVIFFAGLLLILLVTGIVIAAVSFRKPAPEKPVRIETKTEAPKDLQRTPPVEMFDSKKLESLTPPQMPYLMQELPVPEK